MLQRADRSPLFHQPAAMWPGRWGPCAAGSTRSHHPAHCRQPPTATTKVSLQLAGDGDIHTLRPRPRWGRRGQGLPGLTGWDGEGGTSCCCLLTPASCCPAAGEMRWVPIPPCLCSSDHRLPQSPALCLRKNRNRYKLRKFIFFPALSSLAVVCL